LYATAMRRIAIVSALALVGLFLFVGAESRALEVSLVGSVVGALAGFLYSRRRAPASWRDAFWPCAGAAFVAGALAGVASGAGIAFALAPSLLFGSIAAILSAQRSSAGDPTTRT
jgi:ABC-type antimicrobial peptide transport system permease subunit